MKPLSITDYLDRLERGGEKASLPRGGSLFRPRSVALASSGEPVPRPSSPVLPARNRQSESDAPPASFAHKSAPPAAPVGANNATRTQDVAERLAEAHARGREEGLAEGRLEASERHAAEVAALRSVAEAERLEYEGKALAAVEAAIRGGLKAIESEIGGAVARILAPFVEARTARRATDELRAAIARLSAAGSPGLLTIRGPRRLIAPLRERIADLAVEAAYVEDAGSELVVQAGATRITTSMRRWGKLIAGLAD